MQRAFIANLSAGGDQAALLKLTGRTNGVAGGDALAQHLWRQFPEATRTALVDASLDSTNAQALLLPALNMVLQGPCFYESNRFAGVKLNNETEALLALPPGEVPNVRLNRRLLEDAYPKAVDRTQFGGMQRWTLWGGTASSGWSKPSTWPNSWSATRRRSRVEPRRGPR